MPDAPAGARVERIGLVDGGDVHHAVDDDRRDLEARCFGNGEYPGGRECATFVRLI